MELRMYKYRIYPSRKQKARLFRTFKHCKFIYNELLDLNKKLWISRKFDLNSLVKDIKICHPEIGDEAHSQVLQNVSDRLSKAFDNFFRRIKEQKKGKKIKAGFPRFKSRINSIIYPQSGFKFISDKRLFCSKVGNIPIILHRLPKGKIKTLTVKVNKANQWFAVFSCEVDFPKICHIGESVGMDVGLTNFAVLTNGTSIPNPRFLIKSEKKLAWLQRRLSRKKKGSANRRKARFKVARCHLKVVNQRTGWQHKVSKSLTLQFGKIYPEKLNIKGMVKNHCLAKHIHDVAWGNFINMLSYKAITCGGEFAKNPKTRGSSHRCSKCGFYVEDMPLSRKTLTCSKCGFVEHRDINASLNHLNDTVGLTEISTPVDIEPPQQGLPVACLVVETGTICNDS